MFRVAVYRQSAMASFFGVEQVTSSVSAPATFSPTSVGFFYNVSGTNGSWAFIDTDQSTHAEYARVHTSVDLVAPCGCMIEGLDVFNTATPWSTEKPELQGSVGELLMPVGLGCRASNANGKLGTKIDIWYAYTNSATVPGVGDTYGSLQFVCINNGFVLPWDGASPPQIA